MTTNALPITALLAALVSAAKNDLRFYLNGVRIEPNHDGMAVIVGCNGHTLLAITTRCAWTLPPITLPRDTVAALGKIKGLPTVQFAANGEAYTASVGASLLTFELVGGTYPQWQQVIPSGKHDGGGTALAVNYFAAAATVAKALAPEMKGKHHRINVQTRGATNSVCLSFGELADDSLVTNTIMVVMPVRGYEEPHA